MDHAAGTAEERTHPMMSTLLPGTVIVEETRRDATGAELFPVEEEIVRRAVDRRRSEFAAARACARRALSRLGHPPVAIPKGAHGEPCWPVGVVGSITHCRGYRACALADANAVSSIGIDAEPNEPLPSGVLGDVAGEHERAALHELAQRHPAVHWDRLLFSAKEAVYKTWFPLAERWLGFEDAAVDLTPGGMFSVRLLVAAESLPNRRLAVLAGRWLAADGLLLTAIAVMPER